MKVAAGPNYYPPIEEKFNIISHGIGFILSAIALVFLIVKANIHGDIWHLVSFSIFGSSLVILYAASTFFHSAKKKKRRHRLNIFDHSAIYLLIAGTYTPFALVTLQGSTSWVVFGIIWSLAITGIICKFFFIGKNMVLSTIMYILMGWVMVIAIKPLMNNLPIEGSLWLFAGMAAYMIGALFFSLNKMKFNHAIFHKFVLLGSFCHFMSIYHHVLPGN